MQLTLIALVENKPGVLNRVASLFRRRNFNIESLNVGRTEKPDISRMTIVMENGKPVLAIGSPGGSRIIGYVAKTIVAWADWGMNIQEPISMPHGVNRFGRFDLEVGTPLVDLAPALEAAGYEVNTGGLNSGLHAIAIGADGLQGGADPRREGIALGD